MKLLFRLLIVATCIGIVIFVSATDSTKPLEGPKIEVSQVEDLEEIQFNNVSLQRPTIGLSTFIGQSVEEVVKAFKKPHRIEPSSYDYDWWIYNQYEMYVMFGVKDDIVKQVYTNSTAYDVTPYNMYMSNEDILRMTIIDGEISVELDDNVFIYTMSDYDLKYRILVRFEDIYAQLYIDANSEKLTGIRYLDGATLVSHQPYEMQFVGTLTEEPRTVFNDEVNLSNAQILFELTNVFRQKEMLPIFNYSNNLSQLAQSHSEDMFEHQFLAAESPSYGDLKQRAAHYVIAYNAIDENIATGYYDAIEAIHGIFNSSKHRKLVLEEKYSDLGVGVSERYYTQVFLQPVEDEIH